MPYEFYLSIHAHEAGDETRYAVALIDDLRRTTEHGDLVLAAGAACWLARQHSFDPTQHLSEPPPPVREAKRSMRPDTAKPRTPTQ